MDEIRLAVLGAGSVRCMPAIIGSLATYFGERPLEVRFWDADAERLDLFDRFARLCFGVNRCHHRLLSSDDYRESIDEAQRVIVAVGRNCAKKARFPKLSSSSPKDPGIRSLVSTMLREAPEDAKVLSLLSVAIPLKGRDLRRLEWPPEPSEKERIAAPHQILRYLQGDEYLHQFFACHAKTPVKDWLENPDAVGETTQAVKKRE